MADLKITQLTSGTALATDLFPAVDTTDNSMAASGTDKSYSRAVNTAYDAGIFFTVTANQLLIGAGAATPPTGDAGLTYATSILNVPTLLAKTGVRFEDPGAGTNYVLIQAGTLSGNTTYTLPTALPISNGQVLSSTTAGVMSWQDDETGGDVSGPGSATDNTIATFSGGSGKVIQDTSAVLIGGALSGLTQLNVDNIILDGNTISTFDTNGNLLLAPNGTGIVSAASTLHSDVGLELKQTTAGANAVTLVAPSSLSGSFTITLPTAQAAANGYVLSSTTGGITSWVSNAALIQSTVTTSWVGIWSAPQPGNITACSDGVVAFLKIPAISSTANTAAVVTNTGTELPVALRPVTQQEIPIVAFTSNGVTRLGGTAVISTAGVITFSLTNVGIAHVQAGGSFASSGAGGWGAFTIPYVLV